MSIDYQAILYDPIYNTIGVDAELEIPGTGGGLFPFKVIDKTTGVEVGGLTGGVEMVSIVPAAIARMRELESVELTRSDLDGNTITFNDKAWEIKSHFLKPSPLGEADGEVYMILEEA